MMSLFRKKATVSAARGEGTLSGSSHITQYSTSLSESRSTSAASIPAANSPIVQSAVLYRDVIICILQFMPFSDWHTAVQISTLWRDAIASIKPQRLTFCPSRSSFPAANTNAASSPARAWLPNPLRAFLSYWPFHLIRNIAQSPFESVSSQPQASTLSRHIQTVNLSRISSTSHFASLKSAEEVLKHLSIFSSLQCISSLVLDASAAKSLTLPHTLTELHLSFEYKSMHQVNTVIGSLPCLTNLHCSLHRFTPRYDNVLPPGGYHANLETAFDLHFRTPLKGLRRLLEVLSIDISGQDEDASSSIHAAICRSVIDFTQLQQLELFDGFVSLEDLLQIVTVRGFAPPSSQTTTTSSSTSITLPKLQQMHLQHTKVTKSILQCLHRMAPNLTCLKPACFQFEELTLGSFGNSTDTLTTDLNVLFPHLTELTVGSTSVMSLQEAMVSFSNCRSLLELEIDAVSLVQEAFLAQLLPCFPHLRKLFLRVRELHSFDCIASGTLSQTLTHLRLRGLWGLSRPRIDQEVRKLSTKRLRVLEQLQLVDIYDWRQEFWPFETVRHLFEKASDGEFTNLRHLEYTRE